MSKPRTKGEPAAEIAVGDVLVTAGRLLEAVPELEAFVSEISALVEENRRLRESEGPEIMDSKEAAEFLRTTWQSFRELAPSLPRHHKPGLGYRYRRSELLEWLSEPAWTDPSGRYGRTTQKERSR